MTINEMQMERDRVRGLLASAHALYQQRPSARLEARVFELRDRLVTLNTAIGRANDIAAFQTWAWTVAKARRVEGVLVMCDCLTTCGTCAPCGGGCTVTDECPDCRAAEQARIALDAEPESD